MDLGEATRLFQEQLEARRHVDPLYDTELAEEADTLVDEAHAALQVAYLESSARRR